RVVRTDGSEVVGELLAARPDAVVLKLADGTSVTIPRSIIRTIESATSAQAAANAGSHPSTPSSGTTPPAPNPSHGNAAGSGPTAGPTSGHTPASGAPASGATGNGGITSSGAPSSVPRVARDAVAPSGATLELTLNTPIGSSTSSVDDKVDAML